MKLMIVDDSLAIRRKIERCVKASGDVSILTAVNGRDAIDLFKTEMPDMVTIGLGETTGPTRAMVRCLNEPSTACTLPRAPAGRIQHGAESWVRTWP